MRTLAIAIAAALLGSCSKPPKPPGERQATRMTGVSRSPVLSRDGATLVFAASAEDRSNPQIWTAPADGSSPARQLTNDEAQNYDPELAPDGQTIYYTSSRTPPGIYRMPVSGGPSELAIEQGYAARISPDGRTILSGSGGKVVQRAIEGGPSTLVLPALDNSYAPVWSPDGSRILVTAKNPADQNPDWWLVSVAGGEASNTGIVTGLLRQGFNQAILNVWLPNDWIVFSGRQGETQTLWKLRISPDGRMQGDPTRATDDPEGDYGASFAAGKLVYSRTRVDMNFWALPLDDHGERVSGPLQQLTSTPARKGQESAGGTKLLYSAETGDRFSLVLKSGPKEKILRDGFFSVLTPDGSHYAYGEGSKELLTVFMKSTGWWPFWSSTLCRNCGMPRGFSPDGKTLLLWVDTPPVQHLDTLDVRNGRIDRVVWSDKELTGPRLSPDGRWISFVAKTGKHRWQTFAAPVSSGRLLGPSDWIPITPESDSFHFAFWSERGDIVYILTAHGAGGNLKWLEAQRVDPETKRPAGERWTLHEFEELRVPGMDPVWNTVFAANGKIALELGDVSTNIWVKDLP